MWRGWSLSFTTVMTGHDRRRYRFTKRTHKNSAHSSLMKWTVVLLVISLLQRLCGWYRLWCICECVYFGRPESGTLESEFSGLKYVQQVYLPIRLIQSAIMGYAICTKRVSWLFFRLSPGERYGEIRRVENRFNGTNTSFVTKVVLAQVMSTVSASTSIP